MPQLIFVYGTLRRGSLHPMADRLAREATYLGPATWCGMLYDWGDHPGAVRAARRGGDAAPTTTVHGDIYRLDDPTTLDWLDAYEELHEPPQAHWFVRERTEVDTPTGPRKAWIYRYDGPPTGGTRVRGGDYLAWRHEETASQTR